MVKPLYWYLSLNCFRSDIISYLPLLLHDCTDLKYIFLILCVGKGLYLQKNTKAIYILWRCLEMGGGKGFLGIVFWFSDLLLMDFSFIMGICSPQMSSALLM